MSEIKGVWELTVDNLYMDDGKTYKAGRYLNPNSVMLEYIKGNHIHDGKPVFIFHPEVIDEFDPDVDKNNISSDGTEDNFASLGGGDPGSPEPSVDVAGSEVTSIVIEADSNTVNNKSDKKAK